MIEELEGTITTGIGIASSINTGHKNFVVRIDDHKSNGATTLLDVLDECAATTSVTAMTPSKRSAFVRSPSANSGCTRMVAPLNGLRVQVGKIKSVPEFAL